MPLHLVPPGARIKVRDGKPYPNPYYLVRGEIGGRPIEVSTQTRDPDAAAAYKARLELDHWERRVPGPGEAVSFAKAASLYCAAREPSTIDQARIDRLVADELGAMTCDDVQHADLVAAANRLYAGRKNETKNRAVIKPAAAILHYAAENKWCAWKRFRKLKEAPVVTRASSIDVAQALIAALEAEGAAAATPFAKRLARKKALLVLWLFKHGSRVSDPLRLNWEEHVFLARKVYLVFIGKAGIWKEKPLDEEVWQALANEPADDREGMVFPWRSRSGVYKWLRPLVAKLGVAFTPHMARHYLGKQLNAEGAGLKTIMGALDHSDPTSSIRYQDADLQIVRQALRRPGKIMGKRSRKAAKHA